MQRIGHSKFGENGDRALSRAAPGAKPAVLLRHVAHDHPVSKWRHRTPANRTAIEVAHTQAGLAQSWAQLVLLGSTNASKRPASKGKIRLDLKEESPSPGLQSRFYFALHDAAALASSGAFSLFAISRALRYRDGFEIVFLQFVSECIASNPQDARSL